MKLPAPAKALMIAALAAPILTTLPGPSDAQESTPAFALSTVADVIPSSNIAYRQENCASMDTIRNAYLNVLGQTEVGEQYVLSPSGDRITSYYNPRNENTGKATSTIVMEFGDDRDNACIIGSGEVALGDGEELTDPSEFNYHIAVYLAPKDGQLYRVGEAPPTENTVLDTLTFGDGTYVVSFQETPQGIGEVRLADASWTSIVADANYGINVASAEGVQQVAYRDPQPERNF